MVVQPASRAMSICDHHLLIEVLKGAVLLDIIPCPLYGAIPSVFLSPFTGRRHQLRRHCAALGCPIVGDDLYHEAAFDPPGQSRLAAIQGASVQQQKQKHKPQPSVNQSAITLVLPAVAAYDFT